MHEMQALQWKLRGKGSQFYSAEGACMKCKRLPEQKRLQGMHYGSICCAVLLLAASAFALSAGLNGESFKKGSTLQFTGICDTGNPVSITLSSKGRHVFSGTFDCQASYAAAISIDFLFPSGEYSALVSDGKVTHMLSFSIEPSRESTFLVLSLLSPAKEDFYRTEDMNVFVKVTDSGNPVVDANVFVWDFDGNALLLQHAGDGIYFAELTVPVAAKLGSTDLTLVAQENNGALIGGELERTLRFRKAAVLVLLLKPELTNYDTGALLDISATATYPNQKPVEQAQLAATLAGKEIALQQQGDGSFKASLSTADFASGAAELVVTATDAAGNSGEARKTLILSQNINFYLIHYWFYALAAILLALGAGMLVRRQVLASVSRKQLLEEREKLKQRIAGLQTSYFNKATLSKDAFRQQTSELNARLDDINKRL